MDHIGQYIVPIIVAMFASGGFWSFIQSLKGSTEKMIEALSQKLESFMAKAEENDIKTIRLRILRFDDELRLNIRHSREYFDNILDDISDYQKYCKSHPDFKNEKVNHAIAHIGEAYDKCHAENDFL
jgi:hypothetical protein